MLHRGIIIPGEIYLEEFHRSMNGDRLRYDFSQYRRLLHLTGFHFDKHEDFLERFSIGLNKFNIFRRIQIMNGVRNSFDYFTHTAVYNNLNPIQEELAKITVLLSLEHYNAGGTLDDHTIQFINTVISANDKIDMAAKQHQGVGAVGFSLN